MLAPVCRPVCRLAAANMDLQSAIYALEKVLLKVWPTDQNLSTSYVFPTCGKTRSQHQNVNQAHHQELCSVQRTRMMQRMQILQRMQSTDLHSRTTVGGTLGSTTLKRNVQGP